MTHEKRLKKHRLDTLVKRHDEVTHESWHVNKNVTPSRLLSPVFCFSSPVFCFSCPVSYLPPVFTSVPYLPPSPWNTNSQGGKVRLTVSRMGWKIDDCWVGTGEGWSWPPADMEDNCWAGRGEFDHQQGWRMTAGQVGVRLTASRGGRWLLC